MQKRVEPNSCDAGIVDSNFEFYEFEPPLRVNLNSDSLAGYYFGKDSLDINLDGNFDVIISHMFQLGDSLEPDMMTNANFPHLSLTLKKNLEVAIKKDIYPIGLGQTSFVDWVDSLHYKTRIDIIEDWSEPDVKKFMWVIPPTSFWGSYGCWYNLKNIEMYIGIRIKVESDYKYGWIKINEINREELSFISFAIER